MANLNFLEKDLETIIHESDQALVRERGLKCFYYDKIFRQVNLGRYGIADLITVKFAKNVAYRKIIVTIYELKQSLINVGTMLQALGYQKAINCLIEESYDLSNTTIEYNIVMIGSKLDTVSNFCYLPDFTNNISVFTYAFSIDGLRFKRENGYSIPDASFPESCHDSIKYIGRNLFRAISKIPYLESDF